MGKSKLLWSVVGIGLVAALLLSIAHFIHLCTKACAEGENWALFGLPFEITGIGIFASLIALYVACRKYPRLSFWLGISLVASLGAEIWFTFIQATEMSAFCPICLGIAASVAISTLAFFIGRFYTMRGLYTSIPTIMLGFMLAFFGVAKVDKLQAAQDTIEKSVAFGDQNSPIEMYLFTDWACPACRKLEPMLHKFLPEVSKKAKFYFVDFVVHPETMNFVPYNLSFMINNKENYLKIRDILTEISVETGSPEEDQIQTAVEKIGITYDQLNYADVALGIRFFRELGQKYKIQGTPTLVIINKETKKGKKLAGTDEITLKNTMDAITTLQKK